MNRTLKTPTTAAAIALLAACGTTAALCAFSACAAADAPPAAGAGAKPPALPHGFRATWTHLGSWLVADPKAPGHGFHDVYTQAASAAAYRRNGQFPPGTVLVKEIRSIRSGTLTTGEASWADEPKVWFVMQKDDPKRPRTGPNWGDGWGWALYKAESPTTNASVDYRKDCLACHTPAKGTDWVFVQGYPTLKR